MKKTLLDKFFDALQPRPQMPEIMKHIPLFRYPMNYGYTIPQLDLIRSFDDQVYLLEWTIPGQANRQKPTQPRSLPISIGRGIGEQRGKINVGYLP